MNASEGGVERSLLKTKDNTKKNAAKFPKNLSWANLPGGEKKSCIVRKTCIDFLIWLIAVMIPQCWHTCTQNYCTSFFTHNWQFNKFSNNSIFCPNTLGKLLACWKNLLKHIKRNCSLNPLYVKKYWHSWCILDISVRSGYRFEDV